MNKPVIAINIAISQMHNLIIKFCAILSFEAKNGICYTKIVDGALANSTYPRVKLYAILQALKVIKRTAKINIYIEKERDAIKYNEYIKIKKLDKFHSTKDLWVEIFEYAKTLDINFYKADENNIQFQECLDKLKSEPKCIEEDHYKVSLNKKTEIIEKIFRDYILTLNVKFVKLKNLTLLEYTILNFILNYNEMFSEYSIATILKKAKSEYLSDKIKQSVYYGLLENIYSLQQVRSSIYELIHVKHLLEEVPKLYSNKFNNKNSYVVLKIDDNILELAKDDIKSVGEIIIKLLLNK